MAKGLIVGGGGSASFEPCGNNKQFVYIDDTTEEMVATTATVGGPNDGGHPICMDSGTITKITGSIPNNTTGNAATADKLKNKVKITLTGSVTGSVSLDGSEGDQQGQGVTLATTTNHTHKYAGSDAVGGAADSAKKLTNNDAVGGETTPVYFSSNGVPVACTAYSGASVKDATNATNINSLLTDNTVLYVAGFSSNSNSNQRVRFNSKVYINASNVLIGAAWNDYAEFRLGDEQPGTCVVESGFGDVIKSSKRLQKCPYIVSDTYGFCIGEQKNSCAVAVSGRVLARTNEKLNVGDVVCSGKDGTISKMNRLEIILFPDRIVGIVSEIPQYKVWGPKDSTVEVDDRVWIQVR